MSTASDYPHAQGLETYAKIALAVGLFFSFLGLWGVGQGWIHQDPRPLLSWLIGLTFWLSIALGMLLLIMIWYLFGASWPVIIRRQLEHSLAALPYLALAFLPLLALAWLHPKDPGLLWSWLNPEKILPWGEKVAHDALYQGKASYLSKGFFTVRVFLFFGIWWGLAFLFRRFSFKMDQDPQLRWVQGAQKVAAIGIVLVAFSLTFAAIDWFKSLEYHWFSTMYGVWFFSACMRTGLAGTVLLCAFLSKKSYLKGLYGQAHRYELACLCLAFTVFWAYISFSQYFLIYNANIPEETFWYHIREINPLTQAPNSWFYVSVVGLIFGNFFFPFLYLLWYRNKVQAGRLMAICIWILCGQLIDFYFNILPGRIPAANDLGYGIREMGITFGDLAALLGLGGLSLWAFLRSAMRQSPIPLADPRIHASLHHHE